MPDTHYAFTVGKDGLVKYWDADRWELLLTLEGHKAEVCFASKLLIICWLHSWHPSQPWARYGRFSSGCTIYY